MCTQSPGETTCGELVIVSILLILFRGMQEKVLLSIICLTGNSILYATLVVHNRQKKSQNCLVVGLTLVNKSKKT